MTIQATVLASGTTDAQVIAATSAGRTPPRLIGFSITEDAGTPAVARVRLHHGTGTSGTELFDVEIKADEAHRLWMPPGIEIPDGLFVDRAAGTARLTIFTIAP